MEKMWWVCFFVAWLCTFPLAVMAFIAVGRGYEHHSATTASVTDLLDVILNCILLIVSKFCSNKDARITADQVGDSITMREFQGHV